MTNAKRMIAFLSVLAVSAPLCTGCEKDKNSIINEVPLVTDVVTEPATEPSDPKKMEITWFADYDLNPAEGEARSAALTLFEDVYGGKVNFVYASPKEYYDKLDMMLASGEELDMLPYKVNDFPNGTLQNRYQPLDAYFDKMEMDTDLWDDVRSASEAFAFGGKHYVVPYSVSSPVFLTYSRKITEGEELGDPLKLYEEGKWDWSAFTEMMTKFVENAPKNARRYGVQGVLGEALIASTGHTVIKKDSGRIVSNLNDPELAKAGEFMKSLADQKLYLDPKDFPASFPGDHSTLFYVMSDWALPASNGANKDVDLMVVPFPKQDGANRYFFNGTYNAKMLATGSQKGEAVAAYIRCERLAASSEKYAQAEKQAALEVKNNVDGEPIAFVTEEQYDAVKAMCDLGKFVPNVDFGYGMGERMYGFGEYSYETRGVMNNLTTVLLDEPDKAESWQALCEALSGTIDSGLEAYK